MASANELVKLTDGAPIIDDYNKNVDTLKAVLAQGGGSGGGGSALLPVGRPEEPVEGQLIFNPEGVLGGGSGGGGGTGGGTGGVVATGPDTPPAIPNAMDDEFPGPAIDPKWNATHFTLPYTFGNSYLLAKVEVVGALHWLTQPLPVGDCEFHVKVRCNSKLNGYDCVGMGLFANNTQAQVLALLNAADRYNIEGQRWNTNGAYYDTFFRDYPSPTVAISYLSIKRVGEIITYSVSADGYFFFPLYTQDWRNYWLADLKDIAVAFRPANNANSLGQIGIDFFRRVA